MGISELLKVASQIGKPEQVLCDALKKEIISRIVELEILDEKLRKKYGVSFNEFENKGLLDKLGHSWEVEEDYFEWDRITTELKRLRTILNRLI